MDHLLYPPNPEKRPLSILFLCDRIIEPGNYTRTVVSEQIISTSARAFLEDSGWRGWYQYSLYFASVTAQAYLYFGLLYDIFAKFRVSISAADFVEYSEDAGRKVVTLRKLESMVDQVRGKNRGYSQIITTKKSERCWQMPYARLKIFTTYPTWKILCACLFRRSYGPLCSFLLSSIVYFPGD
jgi:hypothetical protein